MTATTARNVEALKSHVGEWNRGRLDGYLAMYDDAIRLHGYTPEPLDKSGVRAFYESIFASFPGNRIALEDIVAEGDRVTTRFTLSGVHGGPFMGVPATKRPIVLPGITILRFAGGRCVERWSQADMLGLLVQVGAVKLPG